MQQILNFCEFNHLLSDHQSAYRQHYSCETLLIRLTNDIICGFEEGLVTAIVFLDLSAAFDTVCHETLLNILKHEFNIGGIVLEWIRSYLVPRKFKVAINNVYSEDRTLDFSIPQGSCNGPLFFNFYCNSIKKTN